MHQVGHQVPGGTKKNGLRHNHCYHNNNKCGRKAKAKPFLQCHDIINQGRKEERRYNSDFMLTQCYSFTVTVPKLGYNKGRFAYFFVWENITWYLMKLVYEVTPGSNDYRMPGYHCIWVYVPWITLEACET